MASNVRGEVDEVREDRLKRRERDRLRRLLVLIGETSPTNTPCTVPEVEAAVEPANSDTSIVKSHVEHLMDTHAYRTITFNKNTILLIIHNGMFTYRPIKAKARPHDAQASV